MVHENDQKNLRDGKHVIVYCDINTSGRKFRTFITALLDSMPEESKQYVHSTFKDKTIHVKYCTVSKHSADLQADRTETMTVLD